MGQKRIDRGALLRDELLQHQGQTPPVQVAGKAYSYKLLKRKECQRVIYSLIPPFVDLVNVVMEGAAIPLKGLLNGDAEGKIDVSKFDLSAISKALRALPFEEFWALAKALLNGVAIEGESYGDLDDHDYYDDKQGELIQAMLMGLRVNYPHLAALIKPASGDDGSTPSETPPQSKAAVNE